MKRAVLSFAIFAIALLGVSSGAAAAPLLHLDSSSNSTVAPGGGISYYLNVSNVGDQATSGDLTLTASFPPGLTATSASTFPWDCSATALPASLVTCTYSGSQDPHRAQPPLEARTTDLVIQAEAEAGASGLLTPRFDLYGGGALRADGSPCDVSPPGAPCATAYDPTAVTASILGFGLEAFDAQATSAAGGTSSIQAGDHPYEYTTSIDFNRHPDPNPLLGDAFPVEPARDIFVDLPPGFIGNPIATGSDRCTAAELVEEGAVPVCPPSSQVGTTTIFSSSVAGGGADKIGDPLPVYNLVPPPGVPARFGFNVVGTTVFLDAVVRTGGDYGITVAVRNISEGLALGSSRVTFWGVPADPAHDIDRACPGQPSPSEGGPSVSEPGEGGAVACSSDYTRPPLKAFFRNPTSCNGPTTTTIRSDSWFNPGVFESASIQSHQPPGFPAPPSQWGPATGVTGCDQVPFEPTITFAPTSHEADSPTGLDFDLTMPQQALSDPNAIAQADVRDAVVRLPQGMSVNPAAADGLGVCSQAQIALHSADAPTCPDNSKLGTVEIVTPLQEDPLTGSIFQAAQNDNPFHSTLAYYTVAKGEGFQIKLAAEVRTNPDTGRLENVFVDNPQLPFEHYRLHFNSGPRAALVNPQTCGVKTANATFSGWAGNAPAQISSSYQVTSGPNGSPCVNTEPELPFQPSFEAGLTSQIASTSSPFVLKLGRNDGEQLFSSLSLTPPRGLLAHLGGIPYCPEATLPSGSCPAASEIGTAWAGAGAGPNTLFVGGGHVYLAGPYKGAPLSLAVVTPAKAGPFDLGNVVVRAAAHVHPETAQLRIVSDPIPQVVQGVSLHLRRIYVAIDRRGFIVPPTSCDPMSIDAAIGGAAGATFNAVEPFQMLLCNTLDFEPKLSIRLAGKTKRAGNPALRATLVMPRKPGANIARAAVTLPHSEFLDQSHLRNICTRVRFNAGEGGGAECPSRSVYGHARAFSPLLDKPLEGPVFLRSSDNPLPDLVAALDGQIHIDLVGRIDSPDENIRTTFDLVPDAPVSKFVLVMQGGRKGLLDNSVNLCRKPHRATALFDGQNGKVRDLRPLVRADCGKGKKGRKDGKRKGR